MHNSKYIVNVNKWKIEKNEFWVEIYFTISLNLNKWFEKKICSWNIIEKKVQKIIKYLSLTTGKKTKQKFLIKTKFKNFCVQ